MHRIVMIGAALVFAVALSASAPAQPWEREAQMHALYLACQQGNIVACIKFGVRISEEVNAVPSGGGFTMSGSGGRATDLPCESRL